MKLVWDEHPWGDYAWWQTEDRKVLKRVNALIEDVVRNETRGSVDQNLWSTVFRGSSCLP